MIAEKRAGWKGVGAAGRMFASGGLGAPVERVGCCWRDSGNKVFGQVRRDRTRIVRGGSRVRRGCPLWE